MAFTDIPVRQDPEMQAWCVSVRDELLRLGRIISGTSSTDDGLTSQSGIGWQLYDVTPSTLASGTGSSGGWQTLTPSTTDGATHAYVYFEAMGGTNNDQVTVDYRSNSSDSTRPGVKTNTVQGSADSTDTSNTIAVPLSSGSFDYDVTGTFSADTSWRLVLVGYFV